MDFFNLGKDDVWRQLSREIGAEYVDGGSLGQSQVRLHHGLWTITLDTYTESSGETSVTYTRMRAPYINPKGFRFKVHHKGFFSALGKLLGMQDIEVGDPRFDDDFIVQGNDESQVRALFESPQIRRMIQRESEIQLEVNHGEAWSGHWFPEDVDELYLQVVGVVTDHWQFKTLFDLFVAVLDRLSEIGAAYKQEPGVDL